MGRKKTRSSGSQAIRQYLKENPKATAGEIVPALAAQGIKVSPSLVNNVKVTLKKKRLAKKTTNRAPARSAGNGITADDLFQAKQLVDELGGIDEARTALETLEKLRSAGK